MTPLLLTSPSNDLARYRAVREAHLANRNLYCSNRIGPVMNFGQTPSSLGWIEEILAAKSREKANLKRQRERIKKYSQMMQSKWPPLERGEVMNHHLREAQDLLFLALLDARALNYGRSDREIREAINAIDAAFDKEKPEERRARQEAELLAERGLYDQQQRHL